MKRLEAEDFEGHVGEVFAFHRVIEMPSMLATADNSGSKRTETIDVEMTLTEIRPYELNPRDGRLKDTSGKFRMKPFSILFECSHEPYLPQGMYDVRHTMFSEPKSIFITCLGPIEKKSGYLYQSVFG